MEYTTLNNGVKMPMAGIGTFLLTPDEAEASCVSALQNGYRLIDTANAYVNEKAVGRAMKKSGLQREEIFLETKLWPSFYEQPDAVDKTLARLDTPYIDLLLIHQPAGNYIAGYRQMEKAYNFDNIDPIAIREALAERGIVGGRIVDAEANRNSPFVRQVMADVEQIAAQERKAQQEEPALDPAERFHVVSLDRGFRTLYAVWDDETHGYYDELKGVLSPEEYAAARASTLNAHYTSPTVIRAIYDAVENMGFQTGNILEPSMGVGNFFGMLPESMKSSRSIAGTFSTSRPIPSHTRTRSDWRMTVRTGRFSRMCMSRSLSEPSLNRCSKSAAR